MAESPQHRIALRPEWAVIGAMLLYASYFSAYSIQKHLAFQTFGYDFSFYIQSLWNTLQGQFLRMTAWPGSEHFFLVVHFAPSMLLLVPLYALWTCPACLLVIQSVAVASAAWPVFRITDKNLQDAWLGVGYACVYLLYPAIQAANLFDFHEITLAAPLLAWAWYVAQRNHWLAFGAIAAIAAGFREEAALTLFIMGFLLSLPRATRKAGVWTMIGTAIWLVLVSWLIFGRTTTLGTKILPRLGLGSSPGEIAANLVFHPAQAWAVVWRTEKASYLLHLFAPVGYLAILAPATLALALPTLSINLVGAWQALYSSSQYHYNAPLAAFVVLSAADGSACLAGFLARHTKFSRRFLTYLLFGYVASLSLGYHFKLDYLPYSPRFRWPQVTTHHRLGEQIAQSIPTTASVSAQNQLAPHVSHRRTVYVFPYVGDADYVFLDLTIPATLTDDGRDMAAITSTIQQLLADPKYRTIVNQDGYVLLKKE